MTKTINRSWVNISVSRKIFFLLVFVLILIRESNAQLITVPLPHSLGAEAEIKSSGAFRIKSNHTLDLPFWDDFSFTPVNISENPLAGFPLDSLWEDSYNVWITDGIGLNAPSINSAALDGIDSAGRVYSNQPEANGFRDVLTSRPIDIGTTKVALPERSSVFLSFFFQYQGNGEPPDTQDYFNVDFFNSNEEWITVATIATKSSFTKDTFYDTLIQVNGEQFFHNQFRFRFRNYGRQSGQFDTWNIDYVYLNKGRTANDNSFNDGALASSLGPVFGDYYSVPVSHFKQDPLLSEVEVDVFNLRGSLADPDPYTYRTTGTFTNFIDGTATTNTQLLTPLDRPIRPGNPLLNPFERHRVKSQVGDLPDPSDPTQFHPEADSTFMNLEFLLVSNDLNFYRSNDTVRANYILKDYYAYDDGSAEYAVALNEPDDRVAYRFDMYGAEPDQLIGFDIFVPSHSLSGFSTADFFVMDSNNGTPQEIISGVSHILRKTTRDSFQRVVLTNPVIVNGSFFIGWKGSFTTTLQIGKDAGNDTGDRIYVNAFGSWTLNTTVRGSLMIRPVFGEAGPITGIEDRDKTFTLYPNPSKGIFFVEGEPASIEIMNVSGQKIPFHQETEDERIQVSLNNARAGIYLVRLAKGNVIEIKKVVIH